MPRMAESVDAHLRRRPTARARRWVGSILGGEVVATRRLKGGISTNTRAVTVARPDGSTRKAVLRTFVGPGWITAEPDLAAREAALLEVLERRGCTRAAAARRRCRRRGVGFDLPADDARAGSAGERPGRPAPLDRRPGRRLGPGPRRGAPTHPQPAGPSRPHRPPRAGGRPAALRHAGRRGALGPRRAALAPRGPAAADAAARRLPPGQRPVVPRPAHQHRRLDRRRASASQRPTSATSARTCPSSAGLEAGDEVLAAYEAASGATVPDRPFWDLAGGHPRQGSRGAGGGAATSTSACPVTLAEVRSRLDRLIAPRPRRPGLMPIARWSGPPTGGYRRGTQRV